ncbi:MAG: hypothetical protein PF501_04540 [Salinisphaera sp.]|jgi:hypothetical protein|nr:hypothetical protein [Salinisphaera sp.]
MTTLNLTITPSRAWMTQDRAAYHHETALPDMSVKGADADHPGESLGELCKIATYPERRLLVGCAGSLLYARTWQWWLNNHSDGDIDAVNEKAPEVLRELVMTQKSLTSELIVLHAGFSRADKRVIGYCYDWQREFEPVRLDFGGHTLMPVVDPRAPDYWHLSSTWMSASEGKSVELFHERLQANQRWQCDNGLLRAGVKLSDAYDLATVTEHGVTLNGSDVAMLEVA